MNTILYKINKSSFEEINSFLKECDDYFFPKLSNYVDINMYSKKLHDLSHKFEAWNNNKLIGLVAAYFNDIEFKKAYISNVSVIKEYQGRGISKQLLLNTINFAKENNFRIIMLEVFNSNILAIELYKRFNFEIVETINDKYIMTLYL